MDFSHFSEQERMQVLQSLEIKQVRLSSIASSFWKSFQAQESMKLYLKVIHTCFNDCVQEFTTKALTTHEVRPPPIIVEVSSLL